jgi:copper(I)-binding protein
MPIAAPGLDRHCGRDTGDLPMTSLRTALVALAGCLIAVAAAAQEYVAGPIRVSKVWTREVPGGAKVAAGFMTITNTGKEPDTLIGGTVPFAAKFEVHEMKMDGGIMQMRQLTSGLVLKPGETVVLKPGSFHLMFMDLTGAPRKGTPVKGTLIFEKAGKIEVYYTVEGIGVREPGGGSAGAKSGHGHR